MFLVFSPPSQAASISQYEDCPSHQPAMRSGLLYHAARPRSRRADPEVGQPEPDPVGRNLRDLSLIDPVKVVETVGKRTVARGSNDQFST